MTRAELIEMASPPCHTCEAPVERVETRWVRNGDGDWVVGPTFLVCCLGHRVLVEALT